MDPRRLRQITLDHFDLRGTGQEANPRFVPRERPCDRCGQQVQGQVLQIAKKIYEYRSQFWELRCNRCDFRQTTKDLARVRKE